MLALFLQGCSFQSYFFDVEPNRSVLVVETAKMKVSYSGDNEFTEKVITQLQLAPLNDFNATSENYVRVNSIVSKTDQVDVSLNEIATQGIEP